MKGLTQYARSLRLGRISPMVSIAFAGGAAWNDSFWSRERCNRLLKQARAKLDQETRSAMCAERRQTVRDERDVVVPMLANHLFATSHKIEHGDLGANGSLDGLRRVKRWCFA